MIGVAKMLYKIEIVRLPYDNEFIDDEHKKGNSVLLNLQQDTDISDIQEWCRIFAQTDRDDKSPCMMMCLRYFADLNKSLLESGRINVPILADHATLKFGPVV